MKTEKVRHGSQPPAHPARGRCLGDSKRVRGSTASNSRIIYIPRIFPPTVKKESKYVQEYRKKGILLNRFVLHYIIINWVSARNHIYLSRTNRRLFRK